jgi:hypothetical protein
MSLFQKSVLHKYLKGLDAKTLDVAYIVFLSGNPTLVVREQVLKRYDENKKIAKKKFLEFHAEFKLAKEMDNFYLDEL